MRGLASRCNTTECKGPNRMRCSFRFVRTTRKELWNTTSSLVGFNGKAVQILSPMRIQCACVIKTRARVMLALDD